MIYSRCHTRTEDVQEIYKLSHLTQDMLNKTRIKVINIIRNELKHNHEFIPLISRQGRHIVAY